MVSYTSYICICNDFIKKKIKTMQQVDENFLFNNIFTHNFFLNCRLNR